MITFSIGEALRFGWEKTKKHFGFLVAVTLGTWFVSFLLNLVTNGDNDWGGPSFLGFLVSMVVGTLIEIGIVRIGLKILDDVHGGIEDFLPTWDLFWKLLVTSILYSLIVMAGIILLIVPGIVWGMRYYFATYLVIDKGLRPMEAFRKSAEITMGHKKQLFLFLIATIGVILLGVIALLVGLLWAIPTVTIAIVYIYRKLAGGEAALPSAA